MANNDYWGYLHDVNELKHGRHKLSEGGAPNGESNDPNYIPHGKKAEGVLNAAGQYVYDKAKNAQSAMASTIQSIRDRVGNTTQQVGDTLRRQYAVAKEKAIGAYNNASGIMKRQYDTARAKAMDAYSGAKGKVMGVYNGAREKVLGAANKANAAVENIRRNIHNKRVVKRNAEAEAARTSYGDMKSKKDLIRNGELKRIKEHEELIRRKAALRNSAKK